MRIGTLNVGHRTRRPAGVPSDLLDAVDALGLDVLVLTEFVATDAYLAALEARWAHVRVSSQLAYAPGRWSNQIAVLSEVAPHILAGHAPKPTQCAATNFLEVEVGGLHLTGLRAPTYRRAKDWYMYWDALRARLHGDVVIGDLNVDPSRLRKRDRVLPAEWCVLTPPGVSYRSQVRDGVEAALDHALVRDGIAVRSAEYRPEFFGLAGLDHCPLLLEIG